MTREEAIEELKRDIHNAKVTHHLSEHYEMAIKALEQEPCEDCISRKEAIKSIKELFEMGDCYCDEYSIIGTINQMPSIQPKPKTGHWKFIQRGKFIDICCSECGYVSVKDYAYNYTIDQLDEQEKKDFFAESHMNFCECCGAKMAEIPTDSEKER